MALRSLIASSGEQLGRLHWLLASGRAELLHPGAAASLHQSHACSQPEQHEVHSSPSTHRQTVSVSAPAGKEAGLRAALGSPPSERLITPVEDYSHIEGGVAVVSLLPTAEQQ